MLQLAAGYPKAKAVKGKEIVRKQKITEPYMEQIMIKLRKAGWVITERGCCGGYRLNAAPSQVSILNLIELFEGPLELVSCCSKEECKRMTSCQMKLPWLMLAESFKEKAAEMTLDKIIELNSEIKEYII